MSLPTTAEPDEELSDQEVLVREWRLSQFRMLGFDLPNAELLAACGHVDLGQVRALIAAGCDRPTALRIVT
jgi:hypothetical protein